MPEVPGDPRESKRRLDEAIYKLESYYGMKLFKNSNDRIGAMPGFKKASEDEILERVKIKLDGQDSGEKFVREPKNQEVFNNITEGNMDFSKIENLKNVTLNELVRMKREKERQEQDLARKKQRDDRFQRRER